MDPESGRIAWQDYSTELLEGRLHQGARTIETNRRCHERGAHHIGLVELGRITPDSELRWGELAGLHVSGIDMLRRRLTVRVAMIEATGKPPRLGTPKTEPQSGRSPCRP